MINRDKASHRRIRVAQVLLSYLPVATAHLRAGQIEKVLARGANGQSEYTSLWEILGRLDGHPAVVVPNRAAAISAALHAWRKGNHANDNHNR